MEPLGEQETLNASTLENILLNLKMISLIKADDKLYLEDGLLKIDTPTIMQGISRWINDYSRLKTIEDIDLLINETSKYVDTNFDKKERNEYLKPFLRETVPLMEVKSNDYKVDKGDKVDNNFNNLTTEPKYRKFKLNPYYDDDDEK